MTASPPDSPSGEVWTSEPTSKVGVYLLKRDKDGYVDGVTVSEHGMCMFEPDEGWQRSVLPIPSAEAIHALRECAEILEKSFDHKLTMPEVRALGERARVALERLKGCER